ncbi:MAG: hypothetical protein JKY34_15385 [Kordiimonadaceae bacterium]|nr:hypothetical protein [Kordiimonadaceae bacterium]MBV1901958.1 hypothetical protein [Kordiimonadaceae bacterium]
MSDYTGFIIATYAASLGGLALMALRSYLKLKATDKAVVALRQARKTQLD